MHVDRLILLLAAMGLVATMSGCSRPTAEPKSSRNHTSQSLPSPIDNSLGNSPVAPTDKAAKAQDFQRQAGIGAALRIADGKVFVTKVLPDTPAARSNLIKEHDQVVAIAEGDEEPIDVTGTKDVALVVGMIRGPVRTVVRLTMVPKGMDETDQVVVSLIRGDIKEIDLFIDGRLLPLGSKAPNFKFTRLGKAEKDDLFRLPAALWLSSFGLLGADLVSKPSMNWRRSKRYIPNGWARSSYSRLASTNERKTPLHFSTESNGPKSRRFGPGPTY